MGQNFGNIPTMDPQMNSHFQSKIATTKIFVISKTNCRACIKAKALLNMIVPETGVIPSFFDVDNYPSQHSKAIMKYISAQTGVTTVPQIWINGQFIGGNDDIQRLHQEGQLIFLIGMGSRRPRTTRVSSFSNNYIEPMLRITPIKTEVYPQPSFGTLPVNNIPNFQKKGKMSKIASYVRRSTHRDEAERDSQRSLSMGNVLAKTNASARVRDVSLSYVPRVETGNFSKVNWSSDEAILNLPSVTLQPRGPMRTSRKRGPDFEIMSRYI